MNDLNSIFNLGNAVDALYSIRAPLQFLNEVFTMRANAQADEFSPKAFEGLANICTMLSLICDESIKCHSSRGGDILEARTGPLENQWKQGTEAAA
jgi:hypothetical protein